MVIKKGTLRMTVGANSEVDSARERIVCGKQIAKDEMDDGECKKVSQGGGEEDKENERDDRVEMSRGKTAAAADECWESDDCSCCSLDSLVCVKYTPLFGRICGVKVEPVPERVPGKIRDCIYEWEVGFKYAVGYMSPYWFKHVDLTQKEAMYIYSKLKPEWKGHAPKAWPWIAFPERRKRKAEMKTMEGKNKKVKAASGPLGTVVGAGGLADGDDEV